MLMCMESVYVVGGCKLLAKGCSAWLAVAHGYEVSFIPTECFYQKKADVSTAIMQSSSEHTQHAQKTALVETAELQSKHRLFSNKAFGWNKGYFVTNVVAVKHSRYSLPCMQTL